ncbi:unnamed protein product [Effrenium voratum]|nr:unnamed protein product [Effrenium voratum]
MSGDSRDLRLGSLESGFAADGSEKLPDLSEHKNLAAEVLSKVPGLYDRLKDRKTKLGITLARCIKAAVDTPDSPDACLFAGDEDCFEDFAEVFDVVIARMHGLLPPGEVNCTVRPQHPAAQPVKPAGAKLDVSARILHSVQAMDSDLQRALQGLGEILRRRKPGQTQAFASSERLGFLTSNLYGLGCSLQASAILKLPRLAAMEVSHPSSAAGSWRSWAGLMRVQVEPVSSLDGHAAQALADLNQKFP